MTADVYKAIKKGSREAELDNGFKQVTKIHRNKKKYNRNYYKYSLKITKQN